MITPEIAAFVVKEYLLPMFESDGKKLLAKKQMRSKSPHRREESKSPDINVKDEKDVKPQKSVRRCNNFMGF